MGFFFLSTPQFYSDFIQNQMSKLKIAIQKKGRLSEQSLALFNDCGIKFSTNDRRLKDEARNFPVELLFLRDDDIPQYVEEGVADIGILGLNEVCEKNKNVRIVDKLGFAQCKLSLAIPKDELYSGIEFFRDKKIATSYPNILSNYFSKINIPVKIEELGGSVEIATGIGLADAIFDIVSTGSTLVLNGLREVEIVMKSEAVLISNEILDNEKKEILNKLLFRIQAVRNAKANKYILLNAPENKLQDIIEILPGMKSPTIIPLAVDGWCSLHSVIREDDFWEVISKLKQVGAEGILVIPIEKMIL